MAAYLLNQIGKFVSDSPENASGQHTHFKVTILSQPDQSANAILGRCLAISLHHPFQDANRAGAHLSIRSAQEIVQEACNV